MLASITLLQRLKYEQWLIALSPQSQHIDSRRKRAFGLENSVGMIGVRTFRPDFGAISKVPPAIRRRNVNSNAKLPSGAGSEAASGQASAAVISFQVAGPDARPASSSANKLSPRRRRQFHRNDHSTSCRSKCLRRNPCRTPRPRRLRFENTRWIHSRTSCAGLSPTATAVWFSSPSQPAQPSVTIQVPGSAASSRNAFSVGPDWSMILRSLTHPGLFSPNTSTRPGDHQPAFVAAPARRRLGALEAVGNARLVRLHIHDQRKPVGGVHRPSDLVHQHPGRLSAPQAQMMLELQGRHPVRMRSHDVEGRYQLLSGTCERCMNVPAAAEVCFLQSRHWRTQRGRLSRTAFPLPQSGQTKPSGHLRRNRSSAHASSSGNISSNWSADIAFGNSN